ncbi:MAG: hypothetical protein OXN89_16050 [Bryobacterales bacterium]|nr:hypothetical protein [Bryobacterales bacterium]
MWNSRWSALNCKAGRDRALVAQLGGYRGRKHETAPRGRIVREGQNRLTLVITGHMLRDRQMAAQSNG